MDIAIASHKSQPLGHRLREATIGQAQRVFARLGHLVRRLELRVEDVNGPRGGVCKRAMAVLRLADGGTLTIEHRHHTVAAALAQALERARDRLARVHDRNRSWDRGQIRRC